MSEESFNSAGKTAAQQQGSRFEDEFTENDLAMVNLGYWDPSADTETDSESGEESDRENASVPEQTSTDQEHKAETERDSDKNITSSDARHPAKITRAVAADAEEFSRVELIPGGVKSAIEAILAVADTPVSVRELSAALIVNERSIEHALDELYREYNGDDSEYGEDTPAHEPRGFELRQVAGGWRLYSRTDFAPWVARFVTRSQSATLSKSAYETLAVIAYRQPVTRAAIAAVRGTNADASVRQLLQRQLVRAAGKE